MCEKERGTIEVGEVVCAQQACQRGRIDGGNEDQTHVAEVLDRESVDGAPIVALDIDLEELAVQVSEQEAILAERAPPVARLGQYTLASRRA